MEQYAKGWIYDYEKNPDAWTCEHITSPKDRRTVAELIEQGKLERKYAPPTDEYVHYLPGDLHDDYPRIRFTPSGRWHGQYTVRGKAYNTPTMDTPWEALVAYQEHVIERELGRRYQVNLDEYRELEQAS